MAVKRILIAFTALAVAFTASHPLLAMPEAAKQETIRLIESIGSSGCEFERNGEWHKSADAVTHLKRKLNATEARLQTAEQFIAYVASSSSVSGQPYRLRCSGGAPMEARPWLERKLAALRGK